MTLLELCEPLFQYICLLNRSGRGGYNHQVDQVRAETRAILERIRTTAASNPELSVQYEIIKKPLYFFADSMIVHSRLPIAQEWAILQGEEFQTATGDTDFWTLLDETLRDKSEAANQRLAVFYTCLGLGFVGDKSGQPEEVLMKNKEIYARILNLVDLPDRKEPLCPDAYFIDKTKLTLNLKDGVWGIVLVLIGMMIFLFLANSYLYVSKTSALRSTLNSIVNSEPGQAGEDNPPPGKTKPAHAGENTK